MRLIPRSASLRSWKVGRLSRRESCAGGLSPSSETAWESPGFSRSGVLGEVEIGFVDVLATFDLR